MRRVAASLAAIIALTFAFVGEPRSATPSRSVEGSGPTTSVPPVVPPMPSLIGECVVQEATQWTDAFDPDATLDLPAGFPLYLESGVGNAGRAFVTLSTGDIGWVDTDALACRVVDSPPLRELPDRVVLCTPLSGIVLPSPPLQVGQIPAHKVVVPLGAMWIGGRFDVPIEVENDPASGYLIVPHFALIDARCQEA